MDKEKTIKVKSLLDRCGCAARREALSKLIEKGIGYVKTIGRKPKTNK